MGAYPDWYPLIRSARYQGVKAWELARQPSYWMHWGLAAEAAESEAAAPSTGESNGASQSDSRDLHYLQ